MNEDTNEWTWTYVPGSVGLYSPAEFEMYTKGRGNSGSIFNGEVHGLAWDNVVETNVELSKEEPVHHVLFAWTGMMQPVIFMQYSLTFPNILSYNKCRCFSSANRWRPVNISCWPGFLTNSSQFRKCSLCVAGLYDLFCFVFVL